MITADGTTVLGFLAIGAGLVLLLILEFGGQR